MTHRCIYCDSQVRANHMVHSRSGWCCRSTNACFNRLLAKYGAMKRAGQMMSNAMYNWAQSEGCVVGKEAAQSMRSMYARWDAAQKGVVID